MSDAPLGLSVLVPAYNEPSIGAALEQILETLEEVGVASEVIVISDGSTDDTPDLAAAYQDRGVRVIHYEANRGKGFAIRTGFAAAKGALVAFIDADLDLHASGISVLCRILDEEHADVVVGSKVHHDSKVIYPRFRRVQSRVFRQIVRAVFDLDVSDTQTGLKVFKHDALELVMDAALIEGFAFDLELLVLLNDAGFRIVEGPVELDYRFTSSTGMADVVDVLADIWRIHRRRRARRGKRRGGVS